MVDESVTVPEGTVVTAVIVAWKCFAREGFTQKSGRRSKLDHH